MTQSPIDNGYPLQWPEGWPRTTYADRSKFKTIFGTAMRELLKELDLLGATDVVISSNMRLRQDGMPYAKQAQPDDRGMAVYFTLNGEQQCIPCDKWDRVEDNLQAIRLTVNALRGLERWGAKEMVDAAFRGFKALPDPGQSKPWHEVLGVPPTASKDEVAHAYKRLAKVHHPDAGGDPKTFMDINRAFKESAS